MAKPASPSRLLGSLIILALLLSSTTGFAQQTNKPAESDQAESEEAVFIPVEYRARRGKSPSASGSPARPR
jgi:hypothetical protein